ncbi:LysR family transcriptional regulator [Salinicola corii]|uniref:LysR family transcriptional regulator n=1 Tax=Salinicola corii TaxID=2606937 RepID=A0A640WI63_9GAMM|nr:LysR family transcriptional regulator [Salinicola corii]KAA0020275.1 LysR family transcriptional regulator [Salinicola corii]
MVRPSLNDLAAFTAVASHLSFRRAADAMGVSRSALSHTIIGLEGKLGVRLFNRTTRSVSLTQAGARMLARLHPVLRDLDQALDTLSEERGTPTGTLRINANKSGARILLKDVVPPFLDRYPDVELDLVSEGRLVDVVEQGFDAGVRLMETVPQDMVAVPFGGEVRFIAVAAPSYLEGRSRPNTPDDLHAHCCIRQRLPSGKRYRWEFSRRGIELTVDVPGNLTLDDNDLLVQAAAEGRGIAYVPEHFAQAYLGSGQLVTVLDDWCPPTPGLALYYPANRHVPASLRAFIDILKQAKRTR